MDQKLKKLSELLTNADSSFYLDKITFEQIKFKVLSENGKNDGYDLLIDKKVCKKCYGRGSINRIPCISCCGLGTIRKHIYYERFLLGGNLFHVKSEKIPNSYDEIKGTIKSKPKAKRDKEKIYNSLLALAYFFDSNNLKNLIKTPYGMECWKKNYKEIKNYLN